MHDTLFLCLEHFGLKELPKEGKKEDDFTYAIAYMKRCTGSKSYCIVKKLKTEKTAMLVIARTFDGVGAIEETLRIHPILENKKETSIVIENDKEEKPIDEKKTKKVKNGNKGNNKKNNRTINK